MAEDIYIISLEDFKLKNEIVLDSEYFLHEWDKDRYFLPRGYDLEIKKPRLKLYWDDSELEIFLGNKRRVIDLEYLKNKVVILNYEIKSIEIYSKELFLEKYLRGVPKTFEEKPHSNE